jgi:catechol 2,3-dioxygenase-like lactoylglutathione lyase family enzyme
MTTATATEVKFQVSLNVTDLNRSVHFYRTLLATEPAMRGAQQVRFEIRNPPVVLCLVPAAQAPGGSLNHVGLRLPDSAALVEVQRRLEEAGIATQRQEGVECCYAKQTKFWVTDPDRHLWELYVLEEDIDHSGFDDAPHPAPEPAANPIIWEHRLMAPVPERIPHADGSVDEVRLEGSFNARLEDLRPGLFLAEAFRVLKPGGRIMAHGLVGTQPAEKPALPGLAALVQRVPSIDECVDVLRTAGFGNLFFEQLKAVTCLQIDDVELREMRLVGTRPAEAKTAPERRVLYKGPLAQVDDGEGTVYPRGAAVAVSERTWQLLHDGPAAGQFLFFP